MPKVGRELAAKTGVAFSPAGLLHTGSDEHICHELVVSTKHALRESQSEVRFGPWSAPSSGQRERKCRAARYRLVPLLLTLSCLQVLFLAKDHLVLKFVAFPYP